MRARISSGGREIELECPDVNTSIRELADLAVEKWHDTDAVPPHQGVGFSAAIERNPEVFE